MSGCCDRLQLIEKVVCDQLFSWKEAMQKQLRHGRVTVGLPWAAAVGVVLVC